MNALVDTARRLRLAEINACPKSRDELEALYGPAWSPGELAEQFDVVGFLAPYVVVRRKADGVTGSLEFQHHPRFYFQFRPHQPHPSGDPMTESKPPRFETGDIRATPGALHLLRASRSTPEALLARHVAGDWGDVSNADKAANDAAVLDGGRLLSAYRLSSSATVWIITEAVGEDARREATTLLLPDEY